MSEKPDDLEAVRIIVKTMEAFKDQEEQRRILRWACEKLGLTIGVSTSVGGSSGSGKGAHEAGVVSGVHGKQIVSIREFVAQKNPRSDNQFAAAVAYYYRFEAPESERKDAVGAADLQEACRQAGRNRLGDPGKTLRNAHSVGLLDKAGEAGNYKINTVGENLVAMTLPGGTEKVTGAKSKRSVSVGRKAKGTSSRSAKRSR